MKFNILYVDPAWTYDDKALAGDRGAGCKYELMTQDDMMAMPVGKLAAEHAVLFMWATFPKMREALDLGSAWGFTYKTVAFTWVKQNTGWSDFIRRLIATDGAVTQREFWKMITPQRWFMGMGRWSRSNAEVCLLFVKGKPVRYNADVNQIVDEPRMRHSAKPSCVRDRIVRLCGKLPRVELFAREATEGWSALGYDVDGQDLRKSIPALIAVKKPDTTKR